VIVHRHALEYEVRLASDVRDLFHLVAKSVAEIDERPGLQFREELLYPFVFGAILGRHVGEVVDGATPFGFVLLLLEGRAVEPVIVEHPRTTPFC